MVVNDLDKLAESRPLTEEEIKSRRNGYKDITEKENLTVIDAKQKSKIKWAIDGDENTKFVHGYANNNNRRNRIDRLMIIGDWCTDPITIKAEALRFFQEKFAKNGHKGRNFEATGSTGYPRLMHYF